MLVHDTTISQVRIFLTHLLSIWRSLNWARPASPDRALFAALTDSADPASGCRVSALPVAIPCARGLVIPRRGHSLHCRLGRRYAHAFAGAPLTGLGLANGSRRAPAHAPFIIYACGGNPAKRQARPEQSHSCAKRFSYGFPSKCQPMMASIITFLLLRLPRDTNSGRRSLIIRREGICR